MKVSTFSFHRGSISCSPSSSSTLGCQFEHPFSQVTSHPANELIIDSNNSRFVKVDTASILVEWIIKEGDDDKEENRDEGLDGGGTCSTAEMTEFTT